jgi:hypothetical protein
VKLVSKKKRLGLDELMALAVSFNKRHGDTGPYRCIPVKDDDTGEPDGVLVACLSDGEGKDTMLIGVLSGEDTGLTPEEAYAYGCVIAGALNSLVVVGQRIAEKERLASGGD